MKKPTFSFHRGTYIILFCGLVLTALTLTIIGFYIYSPSLFDTDTRRWLFSHSAECFDTVAATLCITLFGSALFEYTYKEDHAKKK